jgi:carbon monoxide dehydrogenase subunit G
MARIEEVVEVDTPVSTVWNVLSEPSYLPKLYPAVVTVQADPPGPASPGQRYDLLQRVGSMRLRAVTQVSSVVPESRLVTTGLPGGLFASFRHTVTLIPNGLRTRVKVEFEYTISPEYLAKVPPGAKLEATVDANLRGYTRNLKEICELLPLPN